MASTFTKHNLVKYSLTNEVTTSASDNILRISTEAAIKTIYDFLISHELRPRSDLLNQKARTRINKVAKIPNLSDYVLIRNSGDRFADLTQHLVLLT